MTDSAAPDPIVRTALQLLPIPEHRPAFWQELETMLAAEPPLLVDEPALAVGPTMPTVERPPALAPRAAPPSTSTRGEPLVELAPDPGLGLVPPGVRRRSNVVLSAVAVAAAVMVVVAGTALVRERADTGITSTDLAERADEQDEDVISSTSTSVATITGRDAEVPSEAVMTWVGDLADGDMDAAWGALGTVSQAHFGSQAAFEAEGTGLAEGFGAWSAATPDDVLVTALPSNGEGELVVVTLVGVVDQEGTTQHRADAFPVRIVDGAPHLEPFAFAGELEVVVPEPVPSGGTRPVVRTDDELVVVVPRGVDAPIIRLDDGDTMVCGEDDGTELTVLEGAPGQRCSYHPADGIRPGTRVLTVAFLSPDGSGISAESVLFEAA
jgi:hypothetical protein